MPPIDEYEANIRAIETGHNSVIAGDLNREVADEGAVRLSSISVKVTVKWTQKGESHRDYFAVDYRVKHDEGVAVPKAIGDAHGETDSLAADRSAVAFAVAHEAVALYIEEIAADIDVIKRATQMTDAADRNDEVEVHLRATATPQA
jgi:hypothetical protein